MDSVILKTGALLRKRKHRPLLYKMSINEKIGFVEYQISGNDILLSKTYIPEEYRGKGYGTKMVKECLDSFIGRGYKVIPTCVFIHHFIDENPQYHNYVSRWIV